MQGSLLNRLLWWTDAPCLDSGRRKTVQFPSAFAAAPSRTEAPLAELFAAGEVPLKLYLTLVMMTAKEPHDLYRDTSPSTFARILGYLDPQSDESAAGTRRVKRAGPASGQYLPLVLHGNALDRRGGEDNPLPLDGQRGQLMVPGFGEQRRREDDLSIGEIEVGGVLRYQAGKHGAVREPDSDVRSRNPGRQLVPEYLSPGRERPQARAVLATQEPVRPPGGTKSDRSSKEERTEDEAVVLDQILVRLGYEPIRIGHPRRLDHADNAHHAKTETTEH